MGSTCFASAPSRRPSARSGGFVAGPRAFVDLVINAARPFIFTTAPTPADSAAALAALVVLRSTKAARWSSGCAPTSTGSRPAIRRPIVPIVIGDEADAVAASERLLDDHGLLVPAIRPPTVAAGTRRLRIALSAAHTEDQVERLAKALAEPVTLVVCSGRPPRSARRGWARPCCPRCARPG